VGDFRSPSRSPICRARSGDRLQAPPICGAVGATIRGLVLRVAGPQQLTVTAAVVLLEVVLLPARLRHPCTPRGARQAATVEPCFHVHVALLMNRCQHQPSRAPACPGLGQAAGHLAGRRRNELRGRERGQGQEKGRPEVSVIKGRWKTTGEMPEQPHQRGCSDLMTIGGFQQHGQGPMGF